MFRHCRPLIVVAALVFLAVATLLRAEQTCFDPCVPADTCGKKSGMDRISYYGWLQAGIQANQYGASNSYSATGPLAPASRNLEPFSGNSYLLMTNQPSDFKVDQLWLGVARHLDTKRGFDWGFQTDVMFGTDAKYAQSFSDQSFDYGWGTGDYYLSIPQLYLEAGFKDLKVRAGKYAPTYVHEALPAPMTFFYSHAYICFNAPLTFTGVQAEYALNKKTTVSAGWTTGQENSFDNKFDDNGFTGNITYKPTATTSLGYHLYLGWNNGLNRRADADTRYGRFYDTRREFIHTLVWTWQLSKKWMYMIEGLHQSNDHSYTLGDYTTRAYGINQHLIYTINSKWSVGLRGEWHHAQGTLFDIPGFSGGTGGELYEMTLGLNWNPTRHFNVRPELRYDWTDYKNGFRPFNNQTEANQFSGGVAATISF